MFSCQTSSAETYIRGGKWPPGAYILTYCNGISDSSAHIEQPAGDYIPMGEYILPWGEKELDSCEKVTLSHEHIAPCCNT
jgi:hypothetical protein